MSSHQLLNSSSGIGGSTIEQTPVSSLVWSKHKTKVFDDDENHRPAPRACHTLTVVGTNAFLFGGMVDHSSDASASSANDDDSNGIGIGECAQGSNELFKLDISGKSILEWSKVHIDENQAQPLARWKHTATLFDNTQILIFGGFHSTDHRLNDVWVFDAVGGTWTQPNEKHNAEAVVPCQLV